MDFKGINKISLIGGPSTGKSTLAENMGRKLDLPIIHIDAINYNANWEEVNPKKRDQIIMEKASGDKWVMDGTYMDTLSQRMKMSDLIIYLDYSTIAKLFGILGRAFRMKGTERKEIPGCNDKMDFEFIKFTLSWNSKKRKKVYEALEGIDKDKVIVFKKRKDLNKWYKENFSEEVKTNYL